MRIEAVDAFYLRSPEVLDIGDGSQDALLIRIEAGGFTGWGECEASPLTTIAALVAPMSHSACKPVLESVLGARLDGPESIFEIHRRAKENSADLLQADHALSGIDVALWDLLGKKRKTPVWSFFRSDNPPLTAYASRLFGDTPEETEARAREMAAAGFRMVKFGWGPIGKGTVEEDALQIEAAKSGLARKAALLVDTGCAFGHDVQRAAARIPIFEAAKIGWWEEPFASGALAEYSQLASQTTVKLAAGESCHNPDQARHFIDYGCVSFIQTDCGRIGGITAASKVAQYAAAKGVPYVNHTFTSNLALSASLQPFPLQRANCAEVPFAPSQLALDIGGPMWPLDNDGCTRAPDASGLGVVPDLKFLRQYLQELEITWDGKTLYRTRAL